MVGLERHNRRYTLQSRPTVRIRLRNNHIQSTSSLRKVLRTGAEPPPFRSAVWVNLLGLSSAQSTIRLALPPPIRPKSKKTSGLENSGIGSDLLQIASDENNLIVK